MFRIVVFTLLSSIMLSFSNLAAAQLFKISNSGAVLQGSAVLGSGANNWACTYDSNRGLLWENKTKDGGLRDMNATYSWYNSNTSSSDIGYPSAGNCSNRGSCDTQKYTADVNAKGLCGSSGWRLPTKSELESLVYCPDGKNNSDWTHGYPCVNYAGDKVGAQIDGTYFPNTGKLVYWTSESYDALPDYAWYINFDTGATNRGFKSDARSVRLVRAAKIDTSGVLPSTPTPTPTTPSPTTPSPTTPTTNNDCVPFSPIPCTSSSTPSPAPSTPAPAATNKAPVASFTATPGSGEAPLTVKLNASASTDDGSIVSYVWASTGSDQKSANGQTTLFNYSNPGTYTITLTVTDDKGLTGKAEKQVTVSEKANIPPKADFSVSPNGGNAPLTLSLDAQASSDSDGQVVSYQWATKGSDQQPANEKTALVNFSKAGTYTIILTVTDNKGATGTSTKQVVITEKPNQLPKAAFDASNSSMALTVELNASNSSDNDGNITSYEWESDGQTATGETVTFHYAAEGTYKVKLTVTDDAGGKATLTKDVVVTSTATFFKVSQSGEVLLYTEKAIGNGANEWTCTYDSRTNLVWNITSADQSGNLDKLVTDANTQELCGATGWRLPSIDELRSLIYCSSSQPQTWYIQALACQNLNQKPTVKTDYFPNMVADLYHSDTVYSQNPDNEWFVNFADGSSAYLPKDNQNAKRLLVSSGHQFDSLNNPLAVYNEKTGVLKIDAVLGADGKVYYYEFKNNGDWTFKQVHPTSSDKAIINPVTIAKVVDGDDIELERVYAFGKVFKVTMIKNPSDDYIIGAYSAIQ